MIGAGMVGIETCVTEGDLVCSGRDRYPVRNRGAKGYAELRGAARGQSGS